MRRFIARKSRGEENDFMLAMARGESAEVLGRSVFVWQPGGTAGGNVFVTWPSLYTALSAVKGPKWVAVDTSHGAATIPAGAYNLSDVTFTDALGTATPTITLAVGVTFTASTTNLRLENVVMQSNATATVWAPTAGAFLGLKTAAVECLAAGAFFDPAAGGGVIAEDGSVIGDGTHAVILIENTTSTFVELFTGATLAANAIAQGAAAGGNVAVVYDGSTLISQTQGAGPVYGYEQIDPTPTFIFKPGATGTQNGNVYTTWAALAAAVVQVTGPKFIAVDDSLAAAHVTTGTWPGFGNATFMSDGVDSGNSAVATLIFDAGARLSGVAHLTFTTINVTLADAAGTVIPATTANLAIVANGAAFTNTGGAAGGLATIGAGFALSYRGFTSALGANIFKGAATATYALFLFSGSSLATNTVNGTAGGTVTIVADGSSQNGIAGTTQTPAAASTTVLDPVATFVFQPGGTARGNVFTTWATLMASVSLSPGRKYIIVDNTLAAAHATTGAWNIADCYFTAEDVSTNASRTLIVDDGCSFGGSAVVWWENILLENHNVTTSPFVAAGGVQLSHKYLFGGPQCVGGAVPMYGAPAAGQSVSLTLFGSASIANAGAPVVANNAAGGTVNIRALDSTNVAASTLTGTGAITLRYVDAATFGAQAGLTTLTLTPLEPANPTQASGQSGTGTGTVTVTTGNIQQKKSGQVLVIANIAGVTAAATTVTLQLVRDAATNIGNPIVVTTLSAGDGFTGSIAFVDTLPDAAVHTYKLTATAGAGNLTIAGANSAQIVVAEL